MTRSDVEAILGGPPGDYGGGQRKYLGGNCEGRTCSVFYHRSYFKKNGPTAEEIETAIQRGNLSLWWGRDSAIAVGFDSQGKVTAVGMGGSLREPDFFDRVDEWTGW
jgi:hypothetical protein